MAVAALIALAAAVLPTAPWVLVLIVGALLLVLWAYAVSQFIRDGAWPPP